MIGALLAALLCAAPVRGGADFLDLVWLRSAGSANLLRAQVSGPSAVPTPLAVAPGGAAVAVREGGDLRVLPGELRLGRARAAAFSPDGKRVAAALPSGQIVSMELDGSARTVLGRVQGVEWVAFGAGVVAGGRRGAVLLPNQVLTRAAVRALAARGDRIAVATRSQVLLFDGAGRLLRRLPASPSALALSPRGRLAWIAGREVWMVEPGAAPHPLARERETARQIVFAGERAAWVAGGAHREDGARLDCARFLDATRGLLATCSGRVIGWDGAERTVYAAADCNVSLAWAVPLGDGLLAAQVLRDRRHLLPCDETRAAPSR